MSVTDKIKALISLRGKKNIDVAKHLDMNAQSFQNKLARGSFSADDLIKIATFLDSTLELNLDDKQKIVFDMTDVRT